QTRWIGSAGFTVATCPSRLVLAAVEDRVAPARLAPVGYENDGTRRDRVARWGVVVGDAAAVRRIVVEARVLDTALGAWVAVAVAAAENFASRATLTPGHALVLHFVVLAAVLAHAAPRGTA